MKATVMSVLLCLLSALVEVHCQTVAKIKFRQSFLPNHSYVDFNLVGERSDESVHCRTDLLTCCFFENRPDGGDWYFPTGTRLRFIDSPGNMYEVRVAQRVDLRRRNNGATSGIYRCYIETNAVNDEDGREVVYMGLYASGGEVAHMCIILYSLGVHLV